MLEETIIVVVAVSEVPLEAYLAEVPGYNLPDVGADIVLADPTCFGETPITSVVMGEVRFYYYLFLAAAKRSWRVIPKTPDSDRSMVFWIEADLEEVLEGFIDVLPVNLIHRVF